MGEFVGWKVEMGVESRGEGGSNSKLAIEASNAEAVVWARFKGCVKKKQRCENNNFGAKKIGK